MTDQPGSARFQALLDSAVRAYEEKAGVTLADSEDSLAMRLQCCHSVDDIATLLQSQGQAIDDFQQRDRIFKSIKATVSILSPISSVISVADDVGLTLLPPSKAIHAILCILLNAANGVITSCDVLADMLDSIEHFINRLRIYTETSHSMPAVDEIVIRLMVELISTLALVTRKLKKRRLLKRVKNFFGVKDINAARQRLERLLQEEDRAVGAQALKAIEDNKASTDGVQRTLNQMKRDELLINIRNWLSPPDPWKNFNIARKSRHSDTGAWFVKSNTLSEWKASRPSSLLWIKGKPGAGKSVLCSTIIEEINAIQKSGHALLAMYYYDFREDKKRDLSGLLSSVLFQLCDQSDSYHPILSAFYATHLNGARAPSDDELIRCLINLLKLPGSQPVYLIIDALDECPSTSSLSSPREELLSLLEDLIEEQLPNLRICVTSRPEVDIKTILEPLAFRSILLHDASGQQKDIRNYIESIVSTNRKMQSWSLHHKQLVTDVLTTRADGMFRWVYCQLEYLADCPPVGIQRALDELPATLDMTYERTLREIKDTNSEYARRLLLCVAVASRPLRVEELAEILAFDFEGPIPAFREECRLKNPVEAVLSTCSTLLSVVDDQSCQVVQFSHFSAKEFLTSTRFAEKRDSISSRYHISMTPAHTVITKACLGMLLHLDQNVTEDSLTRFPLAQYAAEHWFEHARFEGVSQNAEVGTKELFDRTKPYLSVWLWIHDPIVCPWQRRERAERPSLPRGTPLHYAAFCGLHDIARVLATEYPNDVNFQSFDEASMPLHLASGKGHVDLVWMLVEHGADVSAQDREGRTPLHWASSNGYVDVARMLVERGTDVSAQDKDGRTPLHWVSGSGHGARMLMGHGANISTQTRDGRTPLHFHWASSNGHVKVAWMLVDHGADMSAKDKDGRTPLHWASSNGHVDMARMLMARGAEVSAQDKDGATPLHWASSNGHVDVARMLVDRGADVSAQDNDGRTPLHWASSNGHVDVARMLVDRGADMLAQDKYGRTPLHRGFSDDLRSFFAHCRFQYLHGQRHARLVSDKTAYDTIKRKRSTLFRFLSPWLFFAPEVRLVEMEKLWTDEVVIERAWKFFMTELLSEWNELILWSTVMLAVDVGFLAIPGVSESYRIRNGTFMMTRQMIVLISHSATTTTLLSLGAAVGNNIIGLLLIRHNRTRVESNDPWDYLFRTSRRYFGIELIAIVFSLPWALLIWSELMIFTALFCYCWSIPEYESLIASASVLGMLSWKLASAK